MKTVKFVFCAICIVFASADTKPHVFGLTGVKLAIDPLIFGGRDALEGQFPYQVSLRERVSGQHFCGGSIISNRFILSAAHCLDGDNSQPKSVYAVVGALHLSQGGVRVDINKITQHEKWDRSKIISDIALLRTASEFAFSNIIRPIALPTQNLPAEGKTPVLLSGWGKNSISNPWERPDILQFTELHTISLTDCTERFKKINPNFERFIFNETLCTFSDNLVRACNGDSGGPLVDVTDPKNQFLVGIVSWGAPNCRGGFPDTFTRVYSYLDWIHEHVDKQSSV